MLKALHVIPTFTDNPAARDTRRRTVRALDYFMTKEEVDRGVWEWRKNFGIKPGDQPGDIEEREVSRFDE